MISISTILIVLLVLMLLGALPTWGHSRNWGYAPSGGRIFFETNQTRSGWMGSQRLIASTPAWFGIDQYLGAIYLL
jgi:hypothetical protein